MGGRINPRKPTTRPPSLQFMTHEAKEKLFDSMFEELNRPYKSLDKYEAVGCLPDHEHNVLSRTRSMWKIDTDYVSGLWGRVTGVIGDTLFALAMGMIIVLAALAIASLTVSIAFLFALPDILAYVDAGCMMLLFVLIGLMIFASKKD